MKNKINTIVFDIDGVLIESDNDVRVEKYRVLFEKGMKLAKSKQYQGTKWMFPKLKALYDKGYKIDKKFYKLINPDTPTILEELSKKYKLIACSVASNSVSKDKLKSTGIFKYFTLISEKPIGIGTKKKAFVDDRIEQVDNRFFKVKFNYGQHSHTGERCDLCIKNLSELLTKL